jgi:hypothetical protein
MNEQALTDALGRVSRPDSAEYLAATEQVRRLPEEMQRALLLHELSKPIEEVLRTEAPFENGVGFMVARDNGYTGFHARQAAATLVEFALGGTDPGDAVARLRNMVGVTEAKGVGVLALLGAEVESPMDLSENIRLIPFDALPDGRAKSILIEEERAGLNQSWAAKSALTINHTIRPLLFPGNGALPKQENPLGLWNLADDVRLALTLAGQTAFVGRAYWFDFEDPDVNRLSIGTSMTSRRSDQPWIAGLPAKVVPEDAIKVVTAFLALNDPLKSRLRLSLSRLNQALCEAPHGDRALDLAIALESLLVAGSNEITYRLALRSALLVADGHDARKRMRAVVTALYEVRSGLIHNGAMPLQVKVKPGGKVNSTKLVEEATLACRDILRTVLFRGELPDWDVLEIGGDQAARAVVA